MNQYWQRWSVLLLILLLTACGRNNPILGGTASYSVTLIVDGRTEAITTEATTVRDLLSSQGVDVYSADQVTPPAFTPLTDGLVVQVVRVTESIEHIEESIPFERTFVRSEAMNADDPPQLIQVGQPGLQERTVRIVYHDGLEVERLTVAVTVLEGAQDEILMIGVGAAPGNLAFDGVIAYIGGGRGLVLRGNTAFPEQLNVGSNLDGRVFSLSPAGDFLLYTRGTGDDRFNTLMVIATERGARARELGVDNVLWADWNPAVTRPNQIAYTTGIPTELPPGWEANNDLWLADIFSNSAPSAPERVVEAYPAKLGWWGGNYAWSPTGDYIAFSYADEVGIINPFVGGGQQRQQLYQFTEYDTLSDWVWVPSLTWSPDGRYLAFNAHRGNESRVAYFDTFVVDIFSGVRVPFALQTGIWSHPNWSPAGAELFDRRPDASALAFLRAVDPIDSLRSNYTLWVVDQDGSNAFQLYPPAGVTSQFPKEQHFMTWGPNGQDLAFIFDNILFILNVESGTTYRITQDENSLGHPTWAPYGAGIGEFVASPEPAPIDDYDPLTDPLPRP